VKVPFYGGCNVIVSIEFCENSRSSANLDIYPEKCKRIRKKPGGAKPKYDLQEVLKGLHPDYPRSQVKLHLLKQGIKKNECEICGNDGTWNGKPVVCILDHINGIHNDHREENLRMVCPMCDSQLDTYKSKNTKRFA